MNSKPPMLFIRGTAAPLIGATRQYLYEIAKSGRFDPEVYAYAQLGEGPEALYTEEAIRAWHARFKAEAESKRKTAKAKASASSTRASSEIHTSAPKVPKKVRRQAVRR